MAVEASAMDALGLEVERCWSVVDRGSVIGSGEETKEAPGLEPSRRSSNRAAAPPRRRPSILKKTDVLKKTDASPPSSKKSVSFDDLVTLAEAPGRNRFFSRGRAEDARS